MSKRTDLKKILVIGAGPIIIGQACEFDYSGTQACKAIMEEGIEVILINSNPATIMTDPETANKIYIEPITTKTIEKIIQKEKPCAILPTVGGQTALNTTIKLVEAGIIDKYNVEIIGADISAIHKAENRELFNKIVMDLGYDVAKHAIVDNKEEAIIEAKKIGFPIIIRPSFTLGGSGGDIANNLEEFEQKIELALSLSPIHQAIIDESLLGWKEYEMEVVRDKKNNSIIVCTIENLDPVGIHTGDSITVAPSLTLTDKEYQFLRNASIDILCAIGIETGGSNVQFAIHPKTGRTVIIEMNPRVSRSSALASKATGFPIAKVAAKLAIGYLLSEIQNDITKITPCSFEPSIDYVVTKIPRFTFDKLGIKNPILSTYMKSVGEVMSIGRSFPESLQKAICSLDTGHNGLTSPILPENLSSAEAIIFIKEQLSLLIPDRLFYIAEALRHNISIEEINNISQIDKWFIQQIDLIVQTEKEISIENIQNKAKLLHYKTLGFSDARLAFLINKSTDYIIKLRHELNIHPVYKSIDTCAAEFPSITPYFYSCYTGNHLTPSQSEAKASNKPKVVILGSGSNRIGQGIEFDYACVHANLALQEENIETIMINCNPETVSTDYDVVDRLYFEPLDTEHVLEVILNEQSTNNLLGVIVQMGGQTPLKLVPELQANNIPILGSSPDILDLAEDRDRFKNFLNELQLQQPQNAICSSIDNLTGITKSIGYPVVIRPSYVLGGRAMQILYNDSDLNKYLENYSDILQDRKTNLLIDKFIDRAIEIDIDAISDGTDVFICAIMEHIETAGIHSGDSACSLPCFSLSKEVISKIEEQTIRITKGLKIIGLINIQFAVKESEIYVLEVNPRASRTLPFVCKATSLSIAKIATKLMIGKKLSDFDLVTNNSNKFSVKEAVFPFIKFPVDVLLKPEMKSTGEVMGIDDSFELAFAKAQIACGHAIPTSGNILISIRNEDKDQQIIEIAEKLAKSDFSICATKGTAEFLTKNGIKSVQHINKIREGGDHVVNKIINKEVDLVINTTSDSKSISDSYPIRRSVILQNILYCTTIRGAQAMCNSIIKLKENNNELSISSIS